MGLALKACHLNNLLYGMGAVPDQGPCHSEALLDQKPENGRTVYLFEPIFQLVLISA